MLLPQTFARLRLTVTLKLSLANAQLMVLVRRRLKGDFQLT